MIPPNMVNAMGGSGLVVAASLQIKVAGGNMLPVDRAIFVVITRQDKKKGLTRSTHQMAYVCQKTEKLVLLREAMTSLGMVNVDIDDAATVCQIMTSPPSSGDGSGCGPGCRSGSGPRCGPSCGGRQDEGVTGG